MSNYIKEKIENTQQNYKQMLCRERVEMVDIIISNCKNSRPGTTGEERWANRKSDKIKI